MAGTQPALTLQQVTVRRPAASCLRRLPPRRCPVSCCLPQHVKSSLDFRIRPATNSAEYRAAAYLRASAFATYPSDRSEQATRMHQRMKADAEWEGLEERITGKDLLYENIRVVSLMATIDDAKDDQLAAAVRGAMDLSCKLPADGELPPQLVIGTLDINQGPKLPAEALVGQHPVGAGSLTGRAYFSDVCVAAAARRRGVAAALIEAACRKAAARGVQYMYTHVHASNIAAVQLYSQRCGFTVEQSEKIAYARAGNRPKQLLLVRPIG
ncbi:hypothetical protein WJX72_005439 [[Myrmecia] bisecta]|uniref:N-acetyltransferase domain-containing protein n=1 Tax=[Myrmecia] bisecta TaxID=41462 RepID=A0AAW1R6F4_9CHLO